MRTYTHTHACMHAKKKSSYEQGHLFQRRGWILTTKLEEEGLHSYNQDFFLKPIRNL